MKKNLADWTKDWGLMEYFFKKDEIETIKEKVRNLEVKQVAYCSFESRFAKSGGLGAVTAKILPWLKEAVGDGNVYLMTPFYPHIIDENKLEKTGKWFEVVYREKQVKKRVRVDIYRYKLQYNQPEKGVIEEYYLKADAFFNARNKINDPYLYHEDNPERNNEAIRENALFFCRAVPRAMAALGIQKNIVFHLQEWQTALIALTSKEAMLQGTLTSCGTVQTMHNSFDSGLSLDMLKKTAKKDPGFTAFQVGLQLVDAPITTVSDHFAEELTTDIIQTRHFAPHLQDIFEKIGVYGVNNGMFVDFPPEFSNRDRCSLDEIKKIKKEKRTALLSILDQYKPRERFGSLTYKGKSIANLPEEIPIFVMSGRLDPGQKGFDILLRAVQRFKEDEIKVILAPMPVKDSHLDYFREVAGACSGNLTVFPLRMEKGFNELQMGAAFGIMPSIYEPFGAAVEYMVNGTVTIARETGGLRDQIIHRVNGLLYREESACYNEDNIKSFMLSGDSVQDREGNPWVQGMVDALYKTLREAVDIYQNHRNDYYRMIIKGFAQAKRFEWRKSAQEYFKVYEKVGKI